MTLICAFGDEYLISDDNVVEEVATKLNCDFENFAERDTSNNRIQYNVTRQAIEKQETNIATLENIRQSNLGIAQDILDYEKNISNVKINQLQTELDKTQSFISQEQKYTPTDLFGLKKYGTTGKQLLSKFDSEFAFYQTAWTGEKGPLSQKSLFPDIYVPFSQSTRAKFEQQARYETAQENIAKANELLFRQQGEIDRLQEEYQTRYGNLSRYG